MAPIVLEGGHSRYEIPLRRLAVIRGEGACDRCSHLGSLWSIDVADIQRIALCRRCWKKVKAVLPKGEKEK